MKNKKDNSECYDDYKVVKKDISISINSEQLDNKCICNDSEFLDEEYVSSIYNIIDSINSSLPSFKEIIKTLKDILEKGRPKEALQLLCSAIYESHIDITHEVFERIKKTCRDLNLTNVDRTLLGLELDLHPVGVRGLPKSIVENQLKRFDQIVKERNVERGGKLPRATDLRPYRFCVQDVIFAIWAMRQRKDEEDIFVEVFLTSEVYKILEKKKVINPKTGKPFQYEIIDDSGKKELKDVEERVVETGYYDKYAGATAATLTILSEAYRVGIPLRVQFGPAVENGQIPFDVYRLALQHGIVLRNAGPAREGIAPGLIEPDEGRRLYLALSGFSPLFSQKIQRLHEQGLISAERVAYMVHHGVWTVPEVEGIVLCSPYPDIVLSGEVFPEHRHLFQHVIIQSRMAIMGGMLDRALAARDDEDVAELQDKAQGVDVEDDERNLSIVTEAKWNARLYKLISPSSNNDNETSPFMETLPLPRWECQRIRLQPEEYLSVLLRPRCSCDLEQFLEEDIQTAAQRLKDSPVPKISAVAVPFDFHDLTEEKQKAFRQQAESLNVVLMVCPEATKALDQLAEKKMAACRMKKEN